MTSPAPAPLLSVVVPAYNAAAYLARALDPLTTAQGRLEVIVVDDGSTDGTGALAGAYAAVRPDRFRVVHRRNGGHGAAIDTGIEAARGTYLKVLDADDWLDTAALATTLATLEHLHRTGGVDALFTDYVHVRTGKRSRVARFGGVFPAGRSFAWHETARFGRHRFLMMHAIIFRTDIVRAAAPLPQHTFYVDSLYMLGGLARVRRMHYLPVPLYHYVIGREGQSVQADVMIARVDQQLRVNRIAFDHLDAPTIVGEASAPRELSACLLHHVEALCAVTSATLARSGSPAHLRERDRFWAEVRDRSPWVHARMRRTLLGAGSNLPGQAGRRVTSLAYDVARRVVGFS